MKKINSQPKNTKNRRKSSLSLRPKWPFNRIVVWVFYTIIECPKSILFGYTSRWFFKELFSIIFPKIVQLVTRESSNIIVWFTPVFTLESSSFYLAGFILKMVNEMSFKKKLNFYLLNIYENQRKHNEKR